jgi:sn1-specific diacylglycerol lipase
MLLLRRRQNTSSEKDRLEPSKPSRDVIYRDLAGDVFLNNIPDIVYFYDYSHAAYGLPLYLFGNLKYGFKHLCCCLAPPPETRLSHIERHYTKPSFCSCFPGKPVDIMESDVNMLHVSLDNSLFNPAFFVCLSPETKSIVVSIRGTLSISDILVDLVCLTFFNAKNAEVTELVLPDGSIAFTHIGMLRAARNVKNELDEHGVLKKALDLFPDYKLVIVGHR